MSAKKITFSNKNKDHLSAFLEFPADGHPKAYAIFAHCFACGKQPGAVGHISRALTQAGFAVLRFDFTGLVENEGDATSPKFCTTTEDLVAAAAFLEREYEPAKLLIGHSLGGAAVLMASLRIKSTEAVATIGAPAHPAHIKEFPTEDVKSEEVTVRLGRQDVTINKQFMADLKDACKNESFRKIGKPLLIMHAPADQMVSIDSAAEIYRQTLHPKSFISLDQADHLLTRKEDAWYAGHMIATWVSRYIQTFTQSRLTSDKEVATRTELTFTTEIIADQHSLIADEPESVGGNDLGPDPYELLTASLGACTGMTLRMYANRKGWALDEVRVHLQHQKIYAEDCQHCENANDKIDHIERIIELEGALDDAQKKRLIEIADKCPVHKTLHTKTEITTTFRTENTS